MLDYPFLVLCGLVCLPALLVAFLRQDLRVHMVRMACLSLPFALTEFLFYPAYWEPPFLFDLARKIGFGIEDFLFVAALGAMAIGVYPAVVGKRLRDDSPRGKQRAIPRMAILIGCALLLALGSWWFGMPAIYAAPGIMLALTVIVLLVWRQDLWQDAWRSGVATLVVYGALCFLLEALMPGVFTQYWHTTDWLAPFAGPVPVEELIYGFAVGFAAAVIYPFAYALTFVKDVRCSKRS